MGESGIVSQRGSFTHWLSNAAESHLGNREGSISRPRGGEVVGCIFLGGTLISKEATRKGVQTEKESQIGRPGGKSRGPAVNGHGKTLWKIKGE